MLLLFCKVSVFLNKTVSFFMDYALFWLALLNGNYATNVLTFSHEMGFFHFTYWLNHYLNVIVNDFILETGVLSVTLFSLLDSFTLSWNEKVCSPFGIDHERFVITKVWACRVPFFTILTRNGKKNGLILLLIGEYNISRHRSHCYFRTFLLKFVIITCIIFKVVKIYDSFLLKCVLLKENISLTKFIERNYSLLKKDLSHNIKKKKK